MSLAENLRLALEGLRANKMRAVLTMLGIIIGIAAVIGILTVGDGLSGSITGTMSSFGASTVSVSLQAKESGLDSMSSSMLGFAAPEEDDLITEEMIEELRKRLGAEIEYVSLTESVGSGQVKDGHLYANVSVTGVNFHYSHLVYYICASIILIFLIHILSFFLKILSLLDCILLMLSLKL